MGAMSLNINPRNEAWLRTKSNMSQVVNSALSRLRTQHDGADIESFETHQLIRIAQSRITMQNRSLTEKEERRLQAAAQHMVDIIEELTS